MLRRGADPAHTTPRETSNMEGHTVCEFVSVTHLVQGRPQRQEVDYGRSVEGGERLPMATVSPFGVMRMF